MNTYKKHQQVRKAFWNKFAQKKIIFDPRNPIPSFNQLKEEFVKSNETEILKLYKTGLPDREGRPYSQMIIASIVLIILAALSMLFMPLPEMVSIIIGALGFFTLLSIIATIIFLAYDSGYRSESLDNDFQENFNIRYVEAVNKWLKDNNKTVELEKYWGAVNPSKDQIINDFLPSQPESLSRRLMKNEFGYIALNQKALGSVTPVGKTVIVEIY